MDTGLLRLILDSWTKPVVFVDAGHVIRYMNKPARRAYARWGHVVGKSIFHCHNEVSCRKIREAWEMLLAGSREVMITDTPKHRVYMRAVRDEGGEVIGYYERYDAPRSEEETERE